MGFIDNVLWEFKGQLTYQDVLGMTLKEIGYLRKHRNAIKEAMSKQPGGGMSQALSEITSM